MDVINFGGWIFYRNENYPKFDSDKVGKWMYFYDDRNFVTKICKKAIEEHIVEEVKHSDDEKGVVCFYLHCDDVEAHRRVLSYFLENNLIRRTKNGRLYNISFKLDKQTLNKQYGDEFHSDIKLENFINLDTEEWLI